MAKRKTSSTIQTRIKNRQLRDGLEQAEHLMSRKRWAEAAQLLQDLDRRQPQQPRVLQAILPVAVQLKDGHLYQYACETLYRLEPRDPDLPYMLAAGYMQNGWSALALTMGKTALAQDPANAKAPYIRTVIEALEPAVELRIRVLGLTGADGLECMCLHDEIQSLLAQGRFAKARQAAEKLTERRPQFAPAYNNGAEACYHDGQIAQAIELTKRLLAFDPDNAFALSNLIRFHCVFGKVEEAEKLVERLKAMEPTIKDLAVKQAQALTLLGDDAAVLEVFAKGCALPESNSGAEDAQLYHLAAVAACRQGREETAREYWRAALKAMPTFAAARENLEDLKNPAPVRNAPWSFALPDLVPRRLIEGLHSRFSAAKGDDEVAVKAAIEYLDAHPEIEGLVPLLLDKSDGVGRELALRLSGMLRTPRMLQAVRAFALGQRGPDTMRLQAAHIAVDAGVLAEGEQRLWLEGAWTTGPLLRFEVDGEPVVRHHAPGVFALIDEARSALYGGDAARAERLLRKALDIDPDDAMALNNLAQVCERLGRRDEAETITIRLHQRHPDYLFACTALAGLATERGHFDRARKLLQPLLSRKRFHVSEFGALCGTLINLELAEGKPDAAQRWLDMWRAAIPGHPALKEFERRVRG